MRQICFHNQPLKVKSKVYASSHHDCWLTGQKTKHSRESSLNHTILTSQYKTALHTHTHSLLWSKQLLDHYRWRDISLLPSPNAHANSPFKAMESFIECLLKKTHWGKKNAHLYCLSRALAGFTGQQAWGHKSSSTQKHVWSEVNKRAVFLLS